MINITQLIPRVLQLKCNRQKITYSGAALKLEIAALVILKKRVSNMKFFYKSFLIVLFFNTFVFFQNSLGETNKDNASSLEITPAIFIPGIMGSPLYDDLNNNNKLTTDEKAWFGAKFTSLWLANNGIDPASNNFNVKVAPIRNDSENTLMDELNEDPMAGYKGFFENLEANGYILDNYDDVHNEGENLFCFTYDWRKNNTYNAELLSNFIDSVRNWTGVASVNLIAHSMGGIVGKKCIALFDKSRIDKMVFMGTPHLGAPVINTTLIKGKSYDWINVVIEEYLTRSLSRNLPSCYQLITSASYFDLEINNGVSTGVESYSECFQLPNGNYTNYSEMIEYLRNYESSLGEDLNTALLNNSELFKETIDTVDFGDVVVFNIVGYNKLTIGKNRVVVGPPPLYWITIEESKTLNGDGTVPLRSAELINNQVFEHTYYLQNVKHSQLPSSQQALEILLGIFSDPPITYFPQYADPPSSYANITDVKNDFGNPVSFYLSQNFPNPFNPSTRISFEIPMTSDVLLKVYDILGKEVATLINEEKPAGSYEVTFDSHSGEVRNLPSGVYFYQLKAGEFIQTRKMILLK